MPGNLITQTQLKGDNFDEWTRAIRTSLRANKNIGFIDGSITQPSETSDEYEDWISVNLMLVSWIMNTIESKLRSTISYRESARDLWIDIQERFNISNGPRIQQLKTELHTCKHVQSMSIEDYYAKLKKLWEALAEVDPILTCECEKCTCNIATKLKKREENVKVHQFLMGVDDSLYETVRSTLLAADDVGGINKIYSSLIREERLRMGNKPNSECADIMSFAVQSGGNMGRNEPQLESKEVSRSCTHCKRTGHEVDSCFQLHEYLEWWSDLSKAPGCGSGRGRGSQHTAPFTRQGRGSFNPRANLAANSLHPSAAASTSKPALGDLDKSGLLGLTGDQ